MTPTSRSGFPPTSRNVRSRAQWLAEAPFNLALGAGFFGFYAHTGLLQVLEERGLRPTSVVGVSAGALAGGLWSAGIDASQLGERLVALKRDEFWDPGLPLGGLLRGHKFRGILRGMLADAGVANIEDCPLRFAAVVHDVMAHAPVAMDRGPVDVAIVASCTVPLMFRPVVAGGRVLVDGGVSDRAGLTALPSGERVLMHYLPSRRRVRWARSVAPPDVPGRPSLVLVTPGLPKVTPFRLAEGATALAKTRDYVERWLDEPADAQ